MGIFSKLVKDVVGVDLDAVQAELKGQLSGLLNGKKDQEEDPAVDDEDDEEAMFRKNRSKALSAERSDDDMDENYEDNPNYQGEIELSEFIRRSSNQDLDEGDIYKIRGKLYSLRASELGFIDDNGQRKQFDLVRRAPVLEYEKKYTFYCEVSDSAWKAIFLRTVGIPCAKCGVRMDEGVEFCPNCGTKAVRIDFCGQCGGPLEPGVKNCPKCGTQVYKEIDSAKFNKLSKNFEEGTRQKFTSTVRYFSKTKDRVFFVHPEKLNSCLDLNIDGTIPDMVSGQKAFVYYTSTGPYAESDFLDEVQPLPAEGPLPQPPDGYEEIDIAIYILKNRSEFKRLYETDRKFWSRVIFDSVPSSGEWVTFKGLDGETELNLDITVPFPALRKGQELIVLYGPGKDGIEDILDSAILYDQWLLPEPEPVVEKVRQEITLDEFSVLQKSFDKNDDNAYKEKKFKSTVRYHHSSQNCIYFQSPENPDVEIGFDFTKAIPTITSGQLAIVSYTCVGRKDPVIDECELLPLPQPPAGYEEIDFFDFILGYGNGKFEPGRKFWSRVLAGSLMGIQMSFSQLDGKNACRFNLTKRPPKLGNGQGCTILYTIAADKDKCPDLDDVLL
ncbi:hypothetical protein FACS189485_05240 [Spirochaetia bacterium]|nr:hypothetical protein FACS189485_05240 [Spirochaetia bacterium]